MAHRPFKNPDGNPDIDAAVDSVPKKDLPPDPEPEAPKVPDVQATKAPLKIHTTKPIDQSMAKIKARRKPPKTKKISEGDDNAESKNSGQSGRPSGDAGRSGGTDWRRGFVLPIDLFRK